MSIRTLVRSFAGGVIGAELFARMDLTKFQTGLAQALNWWVLPHGPAQNRPGFGYVLEAQDSTAAVRLIPFSFNTEQTFVLEFGHQYVRFHTQGATLLETGKNITAVTQASPGVVTSAAHGYSNGDWVYLSAIGGMVELNGRFVKAANVTANTFELTDIHGGANIDTSAYAAYTAGGTVARVYTVATPYTAADLFDIHYTQSADVLTLVHPNYAARELRRLGATNWQLSTISFVPTLATPAAPVLATGGPGGGTPVAEYYKTTAIAADTLEESLASPSSNISFDLTVAGNYINITPAAVAGAVRYNIYKLSNGLYGYIGQTEGSAFKDDNVTADVSQTPPEANDPFVGAGNYPSAVGYHEQRRCFAATDNKPQNFWATRSASENNLSYSIPSRDDDAIAFRIAAREVNRIRHLVSLEQLVMLTSGGEWKIQPQNSDVLTPASAGPKQFAAEGASNVQPVVAAGAVIYVQESGTRPREIKTNQYDSRSFDVRDIAVLAPQLFEDHTLVDMAYSKAPYKMVWFVRSDGRLLGLTYLPEQDIVAWHEHSTDGLFESVACVKEGSEYVLYAVVQRTINTRTVRNIERLHTRKFSVKADAFFVDSGLTYSGAATATLTGFWHLEGETLNVLADGAEHPQVTVTNGAITLEAPATKVHAGLQIVADLQTLPLAFETRALGQGLSKNLSEVALRLKDTLGLLVGPAFIEPEMVDITQRSGEDYDSGPGLITGVETFNVFPDWTDDAQLCIRQKAPLPATVLSLTLDVAVGE